MGVTAEGCCAVRSESCEEKERDERDDGKRFW